MLLQKLCYPHAPLWSAVPNARDAVSGWSCSTTLGLKWKKRYRIVLQNAKSDAGMNSRGCDKAQPSNALDEANPLTRLIHTLFVAQTSESAASHPQLVAGQTCAALTEALRAENPEATPIVKSGLRQGLKPAVQIWCVSVLWGNTADARQLPGQLANLEVSGKAGLSTNTGCATMVSFAPGLPACEISALNGLGVME